MPRNLLQQGFAKQASFITAPVSVSVPVPVQSSRRTTPSITSALSTLSATDKDTTTSSSEKGIRDEMEIVIFEDQLDDNSVPDTLFETRRPLFPLPRTHSDILLPAHSISSPDTSQTIIPSPLDRTSSITFGELLSELIDERRSG